jgi:hypothetical protein
VFQNTLRHSCLKNNIQKKMFSEANVLNATQWVPRGQHIETAVKFFNATVQCASWNATPEHTDTLKT